MNVRSPARTEAIAALDAVLPGGGLLTDEEDLARYSVDWSGDHTGRPLAVARPAVHCREVSALLRCCSEFGIRVVPQGGLTGLVGAAVPTADGRELVISLERMKAVRFVDAVDFAMVVEAGCILEEAKRAAEAQDCLLPITFGAQGSCRIGGNVATNAGGFNVLRYGMTRDLVLGLEVVLADGRIWNGLKVLRKDNRGYDLKQLFIGSEGTLGIVTAVALKLFPRPTQVETALVGLDSVNDAMALYARARRDCSDLAHRFRADPARWSRSNACEQRADLPRSTRPSLPGLCPDRAASAVVASTCAPSSKAFSGEASDLVADGIIADSRAPGRAVLALPRDDGRGAGTRRALSAHRCLGADLETCRSYRRRVAQS